MAGSADRTRAIYFATRLVEYQSSLTPDEQLQAVYKAAQFYEAYFAGGSKAAAHHLPKAQVVNLRKVK